MPALDRRLITAEDLFSLQLVSDPQISSGGERVVYVVKRTDLEENKYFSNLWVVDTASGKARAFTQGNQNDHTPRWSPDGRAIAQFARFLTARVDGKDSTVYLWDSRYARGPAGGWAAVTIRSK